jgi:O-methyltransferase domain/Dimerisation domain
MVQLQTPQAATSAAPAQTIMQMLVSGWLSKAICVAAQLGIADLLKKGGQHYEVLATYANADPRSLYRLLRALASFGIFAETEAGCFQLTPLAECLRADAPNSLYHLALMMGSPWYQQAWDLLLQNIQTGETAFEKAAGMPVMDYFDRHPTDLRVFQGAMANLNSRLSPQLFAEYDFSEFRQIVDVGGGHGVLLTTILRAYPEAKGILFDLPIVIAHNPTIIASKGWQERYKSVGGDFFEAVPSGADAYILKNILHEFNDSRQAIAPNGKLLIMEAIVAPKNEFDPTKMLDLQMLVMVGGGERTAAEYESLLQGADFELTKIFPTSFGFKILEAIPV